MVRKQLSEVLAQEVSDFEGRTKVQLSERQIQRLHEAQLYRVGDLEKLHNAGLIHLEPEGTRVLLRAILQEDASVMAIGDEVGGFSIDYDARKCIAHVVEAVGPAVSKHLDEKGVPDDTREQRSLWRRFRAWFSGRGARERARPMPGDHVFVLSTVADRASKTSRAVRLWTVHVDDLSLRFLPPS
jgi:hypothetical protein